MTNDLEKICNWSQEGVCVRGPVRINPKTLKLEAVGAKLDGHYDPQVAKCFHCNSPFG